jgi:prepilin peptidase dependent protein B
MMMKIKKQSGLTLIEMLIAMLIGLIVLAATIGIFITSLKSNSDTLKMIRLNQEMQAVMTLMTRDVRRSGYWGINTSGTVNPYASTASTSDGSGNLVDDCIVLAYDNNSDGAAGNDYIGYKWDIDRIEMIISNSLPDCSGDWPDLTDPSVVSVAEPAIDLQSYTTGNIDVNVLNIALTGTLTDDSSVSRTIKETIRLRNDVIN